jgi:abscisic-aldehyde oxidase
MAANSTIVDYDIENLEPPILSVEDAVKRSSFFEVPPFLYPKHVGDISKGMAEADHKILSAEVHGTYLFFFFLSHPSLISQLYGHLRWFLIRCIILLRYN